MIYKAYQIQLTKAQRDAVNNYETVPAFEARSKMMSDLRGNKITDLAYDAFKGNLYTHVANIRADDLNHVFEVGNIGPDENIERFGQMASLSPGDIIVDENDIAVVIAPVGFFEIVNRTSTEHL
jgi:hypothetical protein